MHGVTGMALHTSIGKLQLHRGTEKNILEKEMLDLSRASAGRGRYSVKHRSVLDCATRRKPDRSACRRLTGGRDAQNT